MKKTDTRDISNKPDKKKDHRCTIYDVARQAGVSAGTVSHVINRTATISEDTRTRVLDAISLLGYTRNENARALRTSNSKIIGIVLQDIASEYYAQCTAGILQKAQEKGYAVLTLDAHFSPQVLRNGVEALINRRVNGLIFVGGTRDRDVYEMASAAGVSVVFGDRHVPEYPCVQFNNYHTMYHLVRALYRQGYRKFFYYGEALSSQQNLEERYGGFRDALRDLKVPDDQCVAILQNDLDTGKMKKAFHYFQQWFRDETRFSHESVLLTSNDMIAQGVVSAALRSGLRIPEDLAVFGFDNISIAAYSVPSISTVAQDPYLLGEKCFEMLLRQMTGSHTREQSDNLMLEQKVVLRETADLTPEYVLQEGLALEETE